ncbi:MAG: uridine kinase family protein [Eubacteriales bacterium]|jgi:uridine kinase
MMKSKRRFESADEARKFVDSCEADFEARLNAVVEKVCSIEGLKLIGLSGPTCSGKTTAANKLDEVMTALGKNVHVVSIDDFYLDRDVLEQRARENGGRIDYDSEDTIDFDALAECVEEIFSDGPTLIPKFDFIKGRRTGFIELETDDNDMFIFEGIQAIYPKVSELFHRYIYKSIYISVESAIEIEGEIFEPNEIRLMRRIVRDFKFRGAKPEFTMYLWESVRTNEELNIFPYALGCDYFINSTLAFEINLLRPYLEEILAGVPDDNKYRERADRILEKINGLEAIPETYLSPNSLYNEFIRRSGK